MLATRFRIERMGRAWSWLRRRDGLRQILIVVGGFEVYEGLRHLMKPNWPVAVDNAARIEDLERWGHFAWEQSLQRVFLGVPALVQKGLYTVDRVPENKRIDLSNQRADQREHQ